MQPPVRPSESVTGATPPPQQVIEDLVSSRSEAAWTQAIPHLKAFSFTALVEAIDSIFKTFPLSQSAILALALEHPTAAARSMFRSRICSGARRLYTPIVETAFRTIESPAERTRWRDAFLEVQPSSAQLRIIATEIEWQGRHPGFGLETTLLISCLKGNTTSEILASATPETIRTVSGWLLAVATQTTEYIWKGYTGKSSASVHPPVPVPDSFTAGVVAGAACDAARILADARQLAPEARLAFARYMALYSTEAQGRKTRSHYELDSPNDPLLSAIDCLSNTDAPDLLDVASSLASRCLRKGPVVREAMVKFLISHLKGHPEDLARIEAIATLLAEIPEGTTLTYCFNEPTLLALCSLSPSIRHHPGMAATIDIAAFEWPDAAVLAIEVAPPARLREIAKVWARRKTFPRVIDALVRRGVPVFSSEEAFRMSQSSSVDRTSALLAIGLVSEDEPGLEPKPMARKPPGSKKP